MSARRGGIRQRLLESPESGQEDVVSGSKASRSVRRRVMEGAETPRATSHSPSEHPLNAALRKEWARGSMPANKVLELASTAGKQGADMVFYNNDVVNEKNAHRDLCALMGWPSRCPEVKWIDLPFANGEIRPHPIICPLEVFSSSVHEGGEFFNKKFRGELGACSAFWKGIYKHEQFSSHPILKPALLDKTIMQMLPRSPTISRCSRLPTTVCTQRDRLCRPDLCSAVSRSRI